MTKARSNATANAAKGDLTVGNGTNLSGVLGVGSNGDTIVADSSTSTGLRYQGSMAAGRNFVINGGFDIWQRGTSFASTNGYYADRWTNTAELNAVTASRQTSGAPDGSQYYLRLTSTGAASYWSNFSFIETSNCAALWGKTVTVSVKLRKNATANNTGITLALQKSATVDAGSGATWSGLGSSNNVPLASLPTGTTSADWFLATVTATVPNDGTANSIRVLVSYNGATASGSVFDIAQVQLEVGSVPTQFSRAGGTIQGELAACQRYYFKHPATGLNSPINTGSYYTSTNVGTIVPFPVPMRVAPTFSVASGTDFYQAVRNGGLDGFNSFTQDSSNALASILYNNSEASGTAGHAALVIANNASASIAWSAEL